MELTRAGGPVFSAVQSTWNLLETSAGPALAAASRRELTVIVKESLANGRLITAPFPGLSAVADRLGAGIDAVALAAVAAQPWVDRVLLGSAGVGQLAQNLLAGQITLDDEDLAALTGQPEEPRGYWSRRSELPWR
jgi:aryl-alcohol dehydrogenase-like predicted oxidoreductase